VASGKQKWRHGSAYKKWHNLVLLNAGYKCELCNSTKKLQAHHIDSASYFKEERFVVSNGICFCKSCHKSLHILYKQGYRKKTTKKDLKYFLALAKRYMSLGKKQRTV